MSTPNTTPCSRCSAPIPPEDFKQGLAVKVQGEPVCKICVDGGEAQQPVQRIPLMQQNIYRYTHPDHNNLNRFTFLTAGHIALHRRVDREQGQFDPPELPPADNDAETVAVSTNARTRTTKRDARNQIDNDKKSNNGVLIAVAAAVVLLLVIFLVIGGSGDSGTTDPSNNQAQATAPKEKTRSDFSADPMKAWDEARRVLKADSALLKSISEEVTDKIAKQLTKAKSLIDQKDSVKSFEILKGVAIPRERIFDSLQNRKEQLLEERNQLIAGTTETPVTTPDPEPEPIEDKPLPLAFERIFKLSSTPNTDDFLADETSNGYDATANQISEGKIGDKAAVKFETGSYLKIDNSMTYPHSFFLNFWFKIDDNSGESYQWLYSHAEKNTKGSINIYFAEADNDSNTPLALRTVIAYSEQDSLNVDSNPIDIHDGKWHNYGLIVTHDGGAKVLIDGEVLAENKKIKGVLLPNTPLIIGARHDRSNSLRGSMAQIQCYQGTNDIDTISKNIKSLLEEYQKEPEVANNDTNNQNNDPGTTQAQNDSIKDEGLTSALSKEAWQRLTVAPENTLNMWAGEIDSADLDGDGDIDLAVASGGQSYIALNNGDGTFTDTQAIASGKTKSIKIACVDMNGDGHIDIVEGNNNEVFFIFLNDGKLKFKKSKPLRESISLLENMIVADFNNDKAPDILIDKGAKHNFIIYFNDGSGNNINNWQNTEVENSKNSYFNAAIDFDQDGDIDIFNTAKGQGTSFLINDGSGSFSSSNIISGTNRSPIRAILPFQKDGKFNLICAQSEKLSYLEKNGTDFSVGKTISNIDKTKFTITTGNITGNDDDEIVISHNGTLRIIEGENEEAIDETSASKKLIIRDLNADGLNDIVLGAHGRAKPTVYLRINKDGPVTPTTKSDKPVNKTAKADAPMPIILSQFVGKGYKHKSTNVYEEKIENNTGLPKFKGNIIENNYPIALKSRYKSKRNEIVLKLSANNANKGGILVTLHPYDEKRTAIDISLKDGKNKESETFNFQLEGAKWQTLAIDLSNVSGDFDAGNLSEMTIRDAETGNSINFLLYRICFYKDYVPTSDSLPTADQLIMNDDIGPLQFKYKRIMPKRANLDDTVILLNQSLMGSHNFSNDLRKALAPLLGKTLTTAQCVTYYPYDSKWLNDKYVKGVLRKYKPSFVIAIGVGNEMQDGQKENTIDFWKSFCSATYQKGAMPILIAGPDINVDDNTDKLWDILISDQFLKHKLFESVPLINMQGAYMDNRKFKHGKRGQAINDIVRSIHDVFSRVREMPPR